jgi:hypothetical protein
MQCYKICGKVIKNREWGSLLHAVQGHKNTEELTSCNSNCDFCRSSVFSPFPLWAAPLSFRQPARPWTKSARSLGWNSSLQTDRWVLCMVSSTFTASGDGLDFYFAGGGSCQVKRLPCRYCMARPQFEGRGDDLRISMVTIYSISSSGQWTLFVQRLGGWRTGM